MAQTKKQYTHTQTHTNTGKNMIALLCSAITFIKLWGRRLTSGSHDVISVWGEQKELFQPNSQKVTFFCPELLFWHCLKTSYLYRFKKIYISFSDSPTVFAPPCIILKLLFVLSKRKCSLVISFVCLTWRLYYCINK